MRGHLAVAVDVEANVDAAELRRIEADVELTGAGLRPRGDSDREPGNGNSGGGAPCRASPALLGSCAVFAATTPKFCKPVPVAFAASVADDAFDDPVDPWMLRWRSLALSQDRLSLVCRLERRLGRWCRIAASARWRCRTRRSIVAATYCCGAGAPVAEPLGLSDEPEWVAAVSAALVAGRLCRRRVGRAGGNLAAECDWFVRALVCAPIATVAPIAWSLPALHRRGIRDDRLPRPALPEEKPWWRLPRRCTAVRLIGAAAFAAAFFVDTGVAVVAVRALASSAAAAAAAAVGLPQSAAPSEVAGSSGGGSVLARLAAAVASAVFAGAGRLLARSSLTVASGFRVLVPIAAGRSFRLFGVACLPGAASLGWRRAALVPYCLWSCGWLRPCVPESSYWSSGSPLASARVRRRVWRRASADCGAVLLGADVRGIEQGGERLARPLSWYVSTTGRRRATARTKPSRNVGRYTCTLGTGKPLEATKYRPPATRRATALAPANPCEFKALSLAAAESGRQLRSRRQFLPATGLATWRSPAMARTMAERGRRL